jgi:hypothetical protein
MTFIIRGIAHNKCVGGTSTDNNAQGFPQQIGLQQKLIFPFGQAGQGASVP